MIIYFALNLKHTVTYIYVTVHGEPSVKLQIIKFELFTYMERLCFKVLIDTSHDPFGLNGSEIR